MKKIKSINTIVKPKCDCENHYLELFSYFNGDVAATYNRMCYKCGKWWTYTESLGNTTMSEWCAYQQMRFEDVLTIKDYDGTKHFYHMGADGCINGPIAESNILKYLSKSDAKWLKEMI